MAETRSIERGSIVFLQSDKYLTNYKSMDLQQIPHAFFVNELFYLMLT